MKVAVGHRDQLLIGLVMRKDLIRTPSESSRLLCNYKTKKLETEKGKFKVPSLRNVAVTAPYMHNGVFKKLETAVHYYNQFIVNNRSTRTNPETGRAWAAPEVNENLSRELLRQGQPMDQQRLDAIVAFLKTLTDKRYEALLQ